MKLKIFSDRSFLPPNERHVVMLYPFWGLLPEPAGDKDEGRFDEYFRTGNEFFTLVPSIAEADVAVLPFEWRARGQFGDNEALCHRLASTLSEKAEAAGKRVVVFFNNDSDEEVPISNAIVFRTSFNRSTRKANEFAFPGWSVDFLNHYLGGNMMVRKKEKIPTVGYCGYVDYDRWNLGSLMLHVLRLVSGRKIKPGAALRGAAIRLLQCDRRIRRNLIYRTGFAGSGGEGVRREYVKNIVESDYALVTRGAGNFSYRLYEILSCGRIPVFVDTDCVLPYDNLIDWKKYCVWVDVQDLDHLVDRISEFHDNIVPEEFEGLQVAIRRLYEEWISPVGFYRNLFKCLSN